MIKKRVKKEKKINLYIKTDTFCPYCKADLPPKRK